ncbi:MAG: hypothetical protein H0V19_06435 [Euzebyales bacterium]|nr:hypothetical protein [Euzebyales bacterium]
MAAGAAQAVVDPGAGGRLASLVVGGRERLVPSPPAGTDNPGFRWGCFLMAPWAGRIGRAVLTVDGQEVHLPAREGPHALHGLVADSAWRVQTATATTVVARCDLDWQLGGTVEQRVTLTPEGLTLAATVTAGDRRMPAWMGWHPWFARPEEGDLAVRLAAGAVLETAPDLLPTGRVTDVDATTDLRDGPALGERRLDHVYPGVRWPAEVAWPDLRLSIDASPALATAVVHTPPEGACVEPQSAWPDTAALAVRGVEGTGLTVLEPGGTLEADTTWTWMLA